MTCFDILNDLKQIKPNLEEIKTEKHKNMKIFCETHDVFSFIYRDI